jgi:hypothetical protein
MESSPPVTKKIYGKRLSRSLRPLAMTIYYTRLPRFARNDNLPVEIAEALAVFPSADTLPKST